MTLKVMKSISFKMENAHNLNVFLKEISNK